MNDKSIVKIYKWKDRNKAIKEYLNESYEIHKKCIGYIFSIPIIVEDLK
jgi:hypothetical protein